MTTYPPPVRNLIREERDRLLTHIAQEESRARDLRIRLRPLEMDIADLKAQLAQLEAYEPDPTGHSEENNA